MKTATLVLLQAAATAATPWPPSPASSSQKRLRRALKPGGGGGKALGRGGPAKPERGQNAIRKRPGGTLHNKNREYEELKCEEDSHCGIYTGYCGDGACECFERPGRGLLGGRDLMGKGNGVGRGRGRGRGRGGGGDKSVREESGPPYPCRPGDEVTLCDVEPCTGKLPECGEDGYCVLVDPTEGVTERCQSDGDCREYFEACDCSCTALGVDEPDPVWCPPGTGPCSCARCAGNSCDDYEAVCGDGGTCELAELLELGAPPPCRDDGDCGSHFVTCGDVEDLCTCVPVDVRGALPSCDGQAGCACARCPEPAGECGTAACVDGVCELVAETEDGTQCRADGDCRKYFEGCDCSCTALGVNEPDPVWCPPDSEVPCACAMCLSNSCDAKEAVCSGGRCRLDDYVPPNDCEVDDDCETYFVECSDPKDPWKPCSCVALPSGHPDPGCQGDFCECDACDLSDSCEGYDAVCGKDKTCQLSKSNPGMTEEETGGICGNSFCAEDQYCCNESCGICAPYPDGVCIQIACVSEPGGCTTGNDCRLYGGSCDDEPCRCFSLHRNEPDPAGCPRGDCQNNKDPCANASPACIYGKCGLVETLPGESTDRTCTDDAECKTLDNYCGGCNCMGVFNDEVVPSCGADEMAQCKKAPCEGMVAKCVDGTCIAE